MPPQASLECVWDASPSKCDRQTLSKQSPKPQESNAYRRPPNFFSHRPWPFSTAPSLHPGSALPCGPGLQFTQVCHPLFTKPPPTPLATLGAMSSLERQTPQQRRKPGFWDPRGCYPPGWTRAPQPLSFRAGLPSPFFPITLSRPPPTRAASQPGPGLQGWSSHPDAGLQRPWPRFRPPRPCHLPLRGYLQCLPHWTPPSRGATRGTIPAAHWLLPRQPVATPLPIGPAPGSSPSLCGAVSQAPCAEYTKEGWSWTNVTSQPSGELRTHLPGVA